MRLTLVVALVLAVAAGRAEAYPQFQLSLGADRCSKCHFSPAGGGLINDYGRDEAGSTISRGGDGRFLHGAWTPPSWLQLGSISAAQARSSTAIRIASCWRSRCRPTSTSARAASASPST